VVPRPIALDNSVHPPLSRPLADRLGREKRLEGAGLRGRIHADAGVADGNGDACPDAIADSSRDIARFNGQPSAARHGVASVGGQVEQDLLDLRPIGLHQPQAVAAVRLQLDVFAEQAIEQLLAVGDQRVEIDDRRRRRVLTAEAEELADE
jgi:hypothetical protein